TDGWVLIRPSGTEPIIRIYAESKSSARANELMEKAAHLVNGANSLLTA
ncbi:MAG: phosphoglucosamine mutase, partial [Methanosarcinales archaeon]|nr:phosphoglucosamine mutase [Methanosarcinales archaeon]